MYSDLPETYQQYPAHEGLQAEAPEKEIAWSGEQPEKSVVNNSWQQVPQEEQQQPLEKRRPRRICGLVSWLFWLLIAIVAIVVIAAAVGGGVGGSMASKDSSKAASGGVVDVSTSQSSAATSSSSLSTTAPSGPVTTAATTTSSSVSITTTEIVSATSTFYRDCPSVNDTIYTYGSSEDPQEFRQVCNLSYKNTGNGGNPIVNQQTQSLADCIDLCAIYNAQNQTEIDDSSSQPCNAVCWRNTFDTDFPFQCFGYTAANASGRFQYQEETICDSAAWINQPAQ